VLPRVVRAFVRRTRGASYALPAVLVVPVYLAILAVVFELAFLLLAGLGTAYSAHAAARSAAAWQSIGPAEAAAVRPRQAAWAALAPFLIDRQHSLDTAGPVPREAATSARRHRTAAARTTVAVEPVGGRVRATVEFRAPLSFPVASRLLSCGRRAAEFPIRATAELPGEAHPGGPGIDYSPVRSTP